jgi:hypothetical protein
MDEHEAKFLKKMLRTRKAEALEWLRAAPSEMRTVGELEPKDALALVRRIYDAGARKVLVADIQDSPVGEDSNVLLVELPTDTESREQLFQIQAEVVEPLGFEGDADDGQQYLFVGLK